MDKVTQEQVDEIAAINARRGQSRFYELRIYAPRMAAMIAALWSELQAHRSHVCTDNSAVVARLEVELHKERDRHAHTLAESCNVRRRATSERDRYAHTLADLVIKGARIGDLEVELAEARRQLEQATKASGTSTDYMVKGP